MQKPLFKQLGSKYEFYWQKEHVYAIVNRISEHRDGRITAEIHFKTDLQTLPPHIMHTQLNLLSPKSKSALASELENTLQLKGAWSTIIEQLSTMVLEAYRSGQPAKEIWPLKDPKAIPEPEFLVRPLLYKGKPNLFFGEGGTGKSYLALALAILTQDTACADPLGLEAAKATALYLDYETDEAEFTKRLTRLEKGFGTQPTPIFYRECSLPFIEDIDQIETLVAQNNIDFLIIDSLGVASASGNLNEAQTATAFYAALRRLKVTSLLITHTRKDTDTKKADPFGSVYYSNLARSIYQVVKQETVSSNQIGIALYHQKNNQGPLFYPPKGFTINFEEESCWLEPLDVETVPEFLERLNLKARIYALLKSQVKATPKDLAEQLNTPESSIRRTLSRYKNLFVKINKEWGLKARE